MHTTVLRDLIVPNTDSGEAMDYAMLVLSYTETDLAQVTPHFKDEDDIIMVLYNALCALNFLHSTGLMHRDIQSSKFLLDVNNNVRLCDFGSTRPLIHNKWN